MIIIHNYVNKPSFKTLGRFYLISWGGKAEVKKKTAVRLNITQSWVDDSCQGVFVQVKWNPRVPFWVSFHRCVAGAETLTERKLTLCFSEQLQVQPVQEGSSLVL